MDAQTVSMIHHLLGAVVTVSVVVLAVGLVKVYRMLCKHLADYEEFKKSVPSRRVVKK